MTWALDQNVGNPVGKLLLVMIANYADQDATCFPSQKTLAEECEVTDRTVRDWLAKFEETGLIQRTERRRKDGYRTSDMIKLLMPLPETVSAENGRLAEAGDDLTGSRVRGSKGTSHLPSKGEKFSFDPTETWVKLDRDVDRDLWLACEAIMGKKAPTSDMSWRFAGSIIAKAKEKKAA